MKKSKIRRLRTDSSAYKKAMNEVNEIVNTMSKKDKKDMNLTHEVYQKDVDDSPLLVKRFVGHHNGVPVSFLDITGDGSGVSVCVGTRSEPKYRGKGYGTKIALKAKDWIDNHHSEFDQIVWWVRKDNIGSIKIAKRIGFKLDKSSVLPDNPWIKYQYENND